MVRLIRAVAFIVLIFSAGSAFAAAAPQNWYVQKGATGANTGTSWTNAWNELSQINFSSVNCGDTVWLAGGTYTTSLSINKTCSAGAVLNINRVLSTDAVPVASPGWNSSFDSQVIISDNEIFLNGGAYYTVNGRIGTPVGNNFGISVRCTSSGGCEGIGPVQAGALSHITISYVELFGPACITANGSGPGNCSGSVDGFNIAPSSNPIDSLLLDHMWIHRWSETIRENKWSNAIIQYCYIGEIRQASSGGEHEDIVYSYPSTNQTWRYNHIYSSPNDGMFHEFSTGAVNEAYYGNVIYHSGAAIISWKSGSTFGPVTLINNTFENDGTFGDVQPGNINWAGSFVAGSVVENNIYENISNGGNGPQGTVDYNAYSTGIGQDSGAHSFTYVPGTLGLSVMFVNESPSNPVAADFLLTALGATTFQGGKALSAPYDKDPDGNTRGADGHWYLGAYQYVGSQSQGPQPPTGLVATAQ